jgi:hypothetical protein
MQPFAVRVETDRVMGFLTDIQAEKDPRNCCSSTMPLRSSDVVTDQASSAGTHVTTRPTSWWPCPYQRSLDATRPGDTTPRIMGSTGGVSHAGSGDHNSLVGAHQKGNGGVPLSSVSAPSDGKPGNASPGLACPHHGPSVDNAGGSRTQPVGSPADPPGTPTDPPGTRAGSPGTRTDLPGTRVVRAGTSRSRPVRNLQILVVLLRRSGLSL